jgi:hypothetical protein
MSLKSISAFVLAPMLIVSGFATAAPGPIAYLDTYRQQGIKNIDAERGRLLWYSTNGERSCTSCHGETPKATGKHIKSGKVIEPMAPSLNPERYQSAKKIEKWFLRNCKWTFGRECSSQEKADILIWLAGH